MASGGISRSGRVRKKSAKLMEMEDWDAFDLNDAPAKGKKRPRSDEMPEFETPEKKVAPLKIPKATKVPAISPVKRRIMDDMIHLKNLQNIQESGYLNVPAAPKTVQVPQHQPMYPSSAVVDDSSSSSSESSESSSEDDSDSDDSMEYGRPMQHLQLQQKAKKPAFQMIPQAKAPPASAMDFEAASQHARQRRNAGRRRHPPKGAVATEVTGGHSAAPARSKAPAAPRAPKLSSAQRAKKMSTNDDPEYEEPVPKKAAKKTPAPKAPPKPKPPPKEKAKTRPMTAYMLWCQENRRRIVSDNPGMDFATISKKLGETWQMLPDKDKIAWRRKAKVPASKGSTLISTGRPGTTSASAGAPTGASSTPAAASHGGRGAGGAATAAAKSAAAAAAHDDARAIAAAGAEGPKALGIGPVDVAAHLKLLGESLSTIGQRLTEHEGQIAVSGSLSVLLDSTLCALGPLLCLTSLGKEMNGCSKETLTKILNNIAYVMPGL
ncbi:hypothetical protein HPB47_022799 [Ixodes persulcatus]|uniref:Uncharacterized protein n=1 Tax=Ixodes persulcatus TaxID=34615 RepID=A0AC60Q941_IXOPE|nr:hypothetical protein HPB47_022799 [Ixodes persulcatus]